MTNSTTMLNKALKNTSILLLWLLIWQLVATIISSEIIVPTPLSTLNSLLILAKTKEFYLSVSLSLLRIVLGFALGVSLGFIGAVISCKYKLFSGIFSPALKVIRSVPVASFIILAFYWFKSDILPTFICFLMVLPMTWTSVEASLKSIDQKFLELARVYNLSAIKTFFQIKLPFILPSFLATTLTSLGFAWKSGIAAEVICRPKLSLGNILQAAKIYISTPEVFAVTTVVVLLSMLLEVLVKYFVRRFQND